MAAPKEALTGMLEEFLKCCWKQKSLAARLCDNRRHAFGCANGAMAAQHRLGASVRLGTSLLRPSGAWKEPLMATKFTRRIVLVGIVALPFYKQALPRCPEYAEDWNDLAVGLADMHGRGCRQEHPNTWEFRREFGVSVFSDSGTLYAYGFGQPSWARGAFQRVIDIAEAEGARILSSAITRDGWSWLIFCDGTTRDRLRYITRGVK